MKKFVFALICFLGIGTAAHANGITWGKSVVFPIKTVHYKGKVYSGALIASKALVGSSKYVGDIAILNPRVLVYGSYYGLDEVFELDGSADEKGNSRTSQLCLNLGKKFTDFYDEYNSDGPVGYFVSKDVVEIRPFSPFATSSIGCNDR